MCSERDITFFNPTDTIDIEKYSNEGKVHLHRSGAIELTKNICEFLLQQD